LKHFLAQTGQQSQFSAGYVLLPAGDGKKRAERLTGAATHTGLKRFLQRLHEPDQRLNLCHGSVVADILLFAACAAYQMGRTFAKA